MPGGSVRFAFLMRRRKSIMVRTRVDWAAALIAEPVSSVLHIHKGGYACQVIKVPTSKI